jgi:hypothetical protein
MTTPIRVSVYLACDSTPPDLAWEGDRMFLICQERCR